MDKKDFIRTENYSLRLRPSGARKVTAEFNSVINGKVEYRKKNSSWSSALLVKARELSHHLVGKRKAVEFKTSSYKVERDDTDLLRKKIIEMPYTEWKKVGFLRVRCII